MIPASVLPVLNHLWQSTLVVVGVALMALVLRKNCAQVRYWLWLVASVKFLIPFALLVALGSRLEWRAASTPMVQLAVSIAVEQISLPFTPLSSHASAVGFVRSDGANPLATILLAIWFVGFAAILCRWYAAWWRIRRVARTASPLLFDLGVPVLSSPASMEPGIFGIWRPVLLLPEGINEKLVRDHLKAVLAHELCHVRRRDNLAAAIHKFVEAAFWFHPLVWWIGARLVEERERACDEEVLRTGNEPEVYAESILKTCQFYLESPSACMSGVTGAELKERIVRIMAHRAVHRLGPGRKLLLAVVSAAAVAGPVAFGLMSAPQEQARPTQQPQAVSAGHPEFEVASIKPAKPGAMGMFIRFQPSGRLSVTNMPPKELMTMAYNVQPFQVTGEPKWFDSERYDIEAKPDSSVAARLDKLTPEQRKDELMQMMQSLLAERFQLSLHRQTKELPVYALVVSKGGPKLQKSTFTPPNKPGVLPLRKPGGPLPRGGLWSHGPGTLTSTGTELYIFVNILSRQLGRVVIDKTGLKGRYDFTLKWTPDQPAPNPFGAGPGPGPGPMGKDAPPPPDPNGPSIFTALQEQLGLKLESQKGPVEILVIDHVEKPSEN
jgi:uncharacterized protein (TIGR03435 family)